MKGAEALLRTLLAGGVDVCFTNPGTSEMQFVAALDRVPTMRAILTLFEGVATGAADGYGRMAGRPAATLLHLGPGLANGLANLHNARRARVPIVNIVGDHASAHLAYDAPLSSDIVGYARQVSGWVRSTGHARLIAGDTAEAIAAARTAPGQIATLITPADTTWSEADGPAAVAPAPEPARVDQAAIDAAAAALRSGEPAMLLLSGAAVLEGPLRDAGRIAAASGARLASSTFFARMARGAGRVTAERLPYPADQAREFLAGVRHLILVGASAPVSFFAYPEKEGWLTPPDAELHLLARPEHDLADALARLADALGAPAAAPLQAHAPPPPPRGPLTPASLGQALGALIPEGCIVVDEGVTVGLAAWAPSVAAAPHDWLVNPGGAIGAGMPLAIGAAVACPDRPVLNLQADGSAAYTLQALWTQAREGLNIVTVICANRAYRILDIEYRQTGAGAEPGPQARRLISIGEPALDWVGLARSMGVAASRAETAEALVAALAAALKTPGPSLIEAVL